MTDKNKDQIDPVCSMTITEDKAAGHSTFEGRKYYFCSKECKDKFDFQPERYADSVVPKT
jgi:Cu+-exporting ATPase